MSQSPTTPALTVPALLDPFQPASPYGRARAPVEPTAADRANERVLIALTKRVDDLEKLVARNTDDAATALANVAGALAQIAALAATVGSR
jgi:hypothetical protein